MITDNIYTNVSPLNRVLDQLEEVKDKGSYYTARCPAHDDRNPSLSVSEGDDGRALLKCHAGCRKEDIVAAIGLEMRDLFVKESPNGYRNGHEKPPSVTGSPQWPIKDPDGNVVAIHHRLDLDNGEKRVWWTRPDGSKGLGGIRTSDLPLYASERVKVYPEDIPIIICEGEKAADALRSVHIPTLGTVTGASGTPSEEVLEVLRDRIVILWCDNDEAGREHMERVAERLQGIAKEVRIYEWKDAPPGGDAADHPAVLSRSRQGIGDLFDELFTAPVWEPKEHNGQVSLSPSLKGKDNRDTYKRPPLRSVRFNELPDPEPRRYLLDGLVPEGYPTLLYGDGGVAKSMLALSFGLAVARGGGKWLGHEVGDGGTVLYLDFELDASEQRRRALRISRGVEITDTPDTFRYMSALGYTAKEAFDAALQECLEYGVKLLILDSLGPALQGDATAAKDVIGFMQTVLEPFRAAGVTVLIVDHQSRQVSGQQYQDKSAFGSVYKTNLTRSVVQVEPMSRTDDALTVLLRQKKHNFGPLVKPFAADLTFTKEAVKIESRELDSADLITEDTLSATDRVILALEDGPQYPEEIAESTGLALKTVKNVLTKLRSPDVGLVMYTGEKNAKGSNQVSLVSPSLRDGDKDTGNDKGDLFDALDEAAV